MIEKNNIVSVEKSYHDGEWQNTYTVIDGSIRRIVPHDEANTDYQTIQEWIAEGGTVIDNGGGE